MAVSRVFLHVRLCYRARWYGLRYALLALILTLAVNGASFAQEEIRDASEFVAREKSQFAELHLNESGEVCDACTPEAAEFGKWETLVDEELGTQYEPPHALDQDWRPFDSVRAFGFRHSSTHGRHVDRGIPLKGTSWMNRPYHADWFVGPLLGDELISGRVNQENVLLGGIRIGKDIDYYWGLEWRYGRADPNAEFATPQTVQNEISYSVTDIDLIYYPWGDTKFRPYCMLGIGAAQIDFADESGNQHDVTLATLPIGVGVRVHQASWLLWRIEILDNLSFGDDSISTMHNVSITGGMEFRFGARPASYWPWRSSRKIW